MKLPAAHILLLVAFAMPAHAVTLAGCDRVTHISHGGEAGHMDFGGGRVGWIEWWSQEGVYTDFYVADCKSHRHIKTRAREERMSERAPFDRTNDVRDAIETEMAAAPALFSFERLKNAIKTKGRDVEIADFTQEPCACAAAYPELRGDKIPFESDQ